MDLGYGCCGGRYYDWVVVPRWVVLGCESSCEEKERGGGDHLPVPG